MRSIITKAKAAALVFMTYLMKWPKSFKDGQSLREGGFDFFKFLVKLVIYNCNIQCILRFVTPRFVNKTGFVNTFFWK